MILRLKLITTFTFSRGYLHCHEAGLCCYLVVHIENLLRPLQLFYFHLWHIYWHTLVICWMYYVIFEVFIESTPPGCLRYASDLPFQPLIHWRRRQYLPPKLWYQSVTETLSETVAPPIKVVTLNVATTLFRYLNNQIFMSISIRTMLFCSPPPPGFLAVIFL
jgi:hypothetical protein